MDEKEVPDCVHTVEEQIAALDHGINQLEIEIEADEAKLIMALRQLVARQVRRQLKVAQKSKLEVQRASKKDLLC